MLSVKYKVVLQQHLVFKGHDNCPLYGLPRVLFPPPQFAYTSPITKNICIPHMNKEKIHFNYIGTSNSVF